MDDPMDDVRERSEPGLEEIVAGLMSSPEIRDELADLLRRDLLGPWGGETEIFEAYEERTPRDRYIVGLLAPADIGEGEAAAIESALDDGDLAVSESGDEANEAGVPTSQVGRFFPSSLGLTFSVPVVEQSLQVVVSWGRYEQVPVDELRVLVEGAAESTDSAETSGSGGKHQARSDSEPAPDPFAADESGDEGPEGKKRVRRKKGWRRVPLDSGPLIVDLTGDGVMSVPGQHVVVRWRSRTRGDVRLVSVWVVNQQTEASFPNFGKDSAWLFQTRLEVRATDGSSAVFLSRPDLGVQQDVVPDAERELLDMLYRNTPDYAVGHGVATTFDEYPEQDLRVGRRAWRLATESLPTYDVAQTIAPTAKQVPGLANLVLDMAVLASGTAADAVAGMQPLVDSYREWLVEEESRIGVDPDLSDFNDVAREQIRRAREAADRIQLGLNLLVAEPPAWAAFRFANEAMAMQRQHVEAIRARSEDPDLSWKQALANADTPSQRSWRPFQIAFVLINLPSLTDPSHAERVASGDYVDDVVADLLFFPTGGGKTEAYLGLTAYTFAIRRLQGVIPSDDGGFDGERGVAVLMRYTLRLLTAQQFQRAAALVCATEVLRRRSLNNETTSLGREPFTLGLWVGGSVTPNSFTEAESYVKAKKGTGRRSDAFSTSPVPLRQCPWCGSVIDPARDVDANPKTRRVVIYCGDTTGSCEFTNRRNAGHGLPVVAVDEQIYREPPTLLIATVDKFAQLPWNGATAHLFGRVVSRCERHGFKHADIAKTVCGADSHRAEGNLPAARTLPVGRLRPPDLVIQDELHLISGALGTMVGLYETAIDQLATWEYRGSLVRPKVVASTATIRRAREQGYALFRRELTVFPPPILDVGDSFFARQIPVTLESPGRRYLGVCAQGLRLKATEIRVTAAVMGFAQMLFDQNGAATANPADPYMTLVAYFNALRELGGMRRLVDDDVSARLGHPNHAEMERRYLRVVEELTSRIPSDRIPDTLLRLDVRFGPEQSTAARKARSEERKAARGRKAKAAKEEAGTWPVDVLLATNMFAVGVDVSRLGLMSMTGQPKSGAEYIQATSRVGRDPSRPGLIVTIYNWARPRDLSHFERFIPFHSAFYKQDEALSVTPFSLPALERGLTGAFIGALRNMNLDINADTGLDSVDSSYPAWPILVDEFAHRAAAVMSDSAVEGEVRNLLAKRLQDLDRQRALGAHTETLTYRRSGDGKRKVLRQPDADSDWGKWTVANSLRETEPDINLVLYPDDPALEQGHLREWTHPSVTQSGATAPSEGSQG